MAVLKGYIKSASEAEIKEFVQELVDGYGDNGVEVKSAKNNASKKESVIEFKESFSAEQKDKMVKLGFGKADSANLSNLYFKWDGNKLVIAWNI